MNLTASASNIYIPECSVEHLLKNSELLEMYCGSLEAIANNACQCPAASIIFTIENMSFHVFQPSLPCRLLELLSRGDL